MKKLFTYRILKSLFFIAGFCAYGQLRSNHVLGGEITYAQVAGNKYKFTFRIFRNCNGCVFNSGTCTDIKSLDVFASREELGYAKKLGSVPLSLVSRKDATAVCKSAKSICSGGNYGYGMEEWIFEGSLDFDDLTKDYCKFEVGIKIDAREDYYTPGSPESFYNFAQVNICNNIKNNSAVMEAPVLYTVAQNESFTYNPLARDADGDSLSYALVAAEKTFNTGITYGTGMAPDKPVSIYCPTSCTLNKSAWPVEGMGIDAGNGWLGFTPTSAGQKGFVVIEVTEWRMVSGKMVKVGVTRRDLQIEVVDALDYVPKISASATTYSACAGETFNLDLVFTDAAYNGTKDSLSLRYWFDLPGGVLNKIGTSKNSFDAYFSYNFKKTDARNKPYILTIAATDDHCPQTYTTYKTFEIYVTPLPATDFTLKYLQCNKISCKISKAETDVSHSWFLFDGNKLEETHTGNQTSFEVPYPGKWRVLHQAVNNSTGCIAEVSDSLIVPAFKLLNPIDTWPVKVCKDEPFTLAASFTGGLAPFNYYWNLEKGISTRELKIPSDSVISLFVSDASGCSMNFSKKIRLFTPATIHVTDTSLCMPSETTVLNLKNRFSSADINSDSWELLYVTGTAGKFNTSKYPYGFEPLKPADNLFVLRAADSNLCHYLREFHVKVIQAVPTHIADKLFVCSNASAVNLKNASGCTLDSGVWSCGLVPAAIKGETFLPAAAGVGNFELSYAKNLSGCMVRDTTWVFVQKAPIVSIEKPGSQIFCENQADQLLTGIPGGGTWKNAANNSWQNRINPSELIAGGFNSNTIKYSFRDATNGCESSDSFRFSVNQSPKLQFADSASVCSGKPALLEPIVQNGVKASLTGNYSGVSPERYGDNWLFKTEASDVMKTCTYQIHLNALPGCKDLVKNYTLTIKPKPRIYAVSTPASGCAPLNISLQANPENGAVIPQQYEWYESNRWMVYPAVRAMQLSDSGLHSFRVRAVANGCTGNETIANATVYSSPSAAMEVNPASHVVTQDFTAVNFKDKSQCDVPYRLFWQFEKANPASSDKSEVNVAFVRDTGLYKVRLETVTQKGCPSVSETYIRVRPGLQFWVPNAFTPNGKGPDKNESFRIVMDSTVNFHLTIRNRWGEILFASDDQNRAWDGNYLGDPVPNGIYFWEVEANTIYGRYLLRKGVVTLYR